MRSSGCFQAFIERSSRPTGIQLLLENGARVTDGLLPSVQLKVDILAKNAQSGMVSPEAVEARKRFLDKLLAARRKEDR